jgi:hypothetical protein
MVDEQLPDFKDKVVLFYLTNSEYDTALHNPRFEMQNDRLFLTGNVIEGCSTNDWLSGLIASVAWDCVEGYVIFESAEDYLSRLSLAWQDKKLH